MPFRQLIHGRVDRADHQRLKSEAAARGMSMSRCVGDVVREYFALRQEMLSVIGSPDEPGAGHPGLVHSLVSRMEERLGTRADARADELSEGQRRLEALFDRCWLTASRACAAPIASWSGWCRSRARAAGSARAVAGGA